MDKAVLLSVSPEWCKKILDGEKTMEVRKTRPKLETPFKVYIYCTLAGSDSLFMDVLNRDVAAWNRGGWPKKRWHVIAEFTCDEIRRVHIPCPEFQDKLDKQFINSSCLSYNALHNYCPDGDAYFWHISNLKTYPEPKPLSDFRKPCETEDDCCACKRYDRHTLSCFHKIELAPRSWCYVEELK